MPRAAFVTGGSGFIGGALVERLVADGWRVRALAAATRAPSVVADRGAEAVRGDLDDVAAMADGARGCDVAFHCAAHLGDWGGRRTSSAATCRAARTSSRPAAAPACAAGPRRHRGRACSPGSRSSTPTRARRCSPTRRRCTRRRRRAPRRSCSPPTATASRPSSCARASSGAAATRRCCRAMVEMVQAGAFAWIGGGRHRTSTTHVDNVVEGLVLARRRRRPRRTPTSSPTASRSSSATSSRELLATQGVEAPTRSVPAPLARAVAARRRAAVAHAAAARRAAADALRRLALLARHDARRLARARASSATRRSSRIDAGPRRARPRSGAPA